MTKQELIKSIAQTYAKGLKIIEKKNQDYAKGNDAFSNFRSAEIIGISAEQAILVRVLDKISRIANLLTKENAVKDESISDTLIDCINYLAILKSKIENNK